jgi:hypothetical protein
MSEVIEPALAAGAQAVIKALAPEAEAVLHEIHDYATAEFVKLDDAFPRLLQTAETDAHAALRTAESHLGAVVNAIRAKLGIPALGEPVEQLPEGQFATVSGPAVNVPEDSIQLSDGAPVGPTSAAAAPQS